MRVVIIGGGIAAVYLANNLKKEKASFEVMILSDEKYPPYDRIHLCRLLDESHEHQGIALALDPSKQTMQEIQKIQEDIMYPMG